MLKFKISSERLAEACNTIEYLNIMAGLKDTAMRTIHLFLLDEKGEYVVKIVLDEDGDVAEKQNTAKAITMLTALTPKRLEKLTTELMEAAKAVVNPPNTGG